MEPHPGRDARAPGRPEQRCWATQGHGQACLSGLLLSVGPGVPTPQIASQDFRCLTQQCSGKEHGTARRETCFRPQLSNLEQVTASLQTWLLLIAHLLLCSVLSVSTSMEPWMVDGT